ncbi:unnamed protein product, partial [Rotaria socialis]
IHYSIQGYISACVRGKYISDIFFFNIAGEYRFCTRKGSHHQRNTTVILIDIKNETYSIQCKDSEYVINNFKSINDTDHLASDHRSNGRVGMYGISWSGFNTLMMSTLRRPFALKALFTAHVTDDLYKSDIHYSDGIMHLDQYFIFIDHSNAIPAPIDYNMNDQWTRERFRR